MSNILVFQTYSNRLSYSLLVTTVIVGLLLSYFFYSGPFYAFDDLGYLMFAHQLNIGKFNPAQSPYAYGFLLPISIATSFAIFGVNTFTSTLPSLMEYIIIIVISFLIGKRLYGNNTGLISAFLVSTAPFVLGYSTRVLPDMGVGALVGISMLFLVYAQESNNKKLFYFLAGAFATMTIYIKLIGLAYMLAFLIALFIYNFYKNKKSEKQSTNGILIYPLVGMLFLGVIYMAIMLVSSGSLFGTFVKYGTNQMTISPSSLNNNINTLFITLLGYNSFGPLSNPQVFPLGFIIFLAMIGTMIGLIKKEINIIVISVILWISFFYLFFGTVTIAKYSFIYVVSRYFIMISVPIAVMASYALLEIYNASTPLLKTNSIYLLAFIIVIIFISYIPTYATLYNYNISISGDARVFSNMLSYVRTNSPDSNTLLVTTDSGTLNFLEFLSRYNKTIEMYTLNTSNKIKITAQLNTICTPNSVNTYIIIAYDNYSKLQYITTFNDWINTSCNLVRLRNFSDNASSNSAYNGMNVYINLYKVK